jgi:type III pantothenate kinase
MTAIDKNSRFLGGAILPGVNISAESLASETSQLPRVSIIAPKRCISSNTVECIQSGLVFGQAAAIDGIIDRMEEELGYKAQLLATGGLSSVIIPNCRHKIDIEPDLLLKGLAIIWEKNKDRY